MPNPLPPDGGGGNGGGSGSGTSLDYNKMADTIFDAMDGYGTGNSTIEDELKKLKSRSDYSKSYSRC